MISLLPEQSGISSLQLVAGYFEAVTIFGSVVVNIIRMKLTEEQLADLDRQFDYALAAKPSEAYKRWPKLPVADYDELPLPQQERYKQFIHLVAHGIIPEGYNQNRQP